MCIEDRPTSNPTMISSSLSNSTDSVSMKHIRKNFNNGRKLSIDVEAGMDSSFVSLASKTPASDRLKDLVASTWQGMRSGFSPTLCEAGVGGTYFMKDSHNKRIGVFKPNDEEMGCLNNPKGFTPMSASSYTDSSKNRGVVGGEAAFRECAAFVLDHENFSGVPATDLVACNYPGFSNSPGALLPEENIKIGSFQEFKEHDFDAEDISPVKASRFPVSEVHKIAILDIRLFNTDRHGGNILVRRVYSPLMRKYGEDDFDSPRPRSGYNSDADENGAHIDMQFRLDIESDEEDMSSLSSSVSSLADEDEEVSSFELIPIDHGYTLPHTVSGLTDSWFEWLNWPQSKSPFTQETKKYIERLDAERDVTLLNQKFGDLFPSDCYKVLRITTMWLKKGAQLNLSPYDIGVRMCRRQFDTPSDLEKMCRAAEEAVPQTLPCEGKDAADALFYVKLAEEMDKKLKEVAKAPTPAPAAANHHHHNHIRKLW